MKFDLENEEDVFVLYDIITLTTPYQTKGETINKVSNFLQILSVLRGIKSGFMCSYTEYIDMHELEWLVSRHKILNISPKDFLFVNVGEMYDENSVFTIIINKDRARSVLSSIISEYQEWSDESIINYIRGMREYTIPGTTDNVILGALLSYPCRQDGTQRNKRIRYVMQFRERTKQRLQLRDTEITLYGFVCPMNQVDANLLSMEQTRNHLDMYFNMFLDFGQVRLEISN